MINKLIKILEILTLCCPSDQLIYECLWAEHDIIGFRIDPEDISKEDMKTLEELGVFYSEDYNSLAIFV